MEGFVTMHMQTPLCGDTLPVQGKCSFRDMRVTFKFPTRRIDFELPSLPSLGIDCDFFIEGEHGDILMTLDYVKELDCFTGIGKQKDDGKTVIWFTFWTNDSPMKSMKAFY